jgi:hypothetical protein
MSMVVVHVASGTRDILVFLGRMAEDMGHALHRPLHYTRPKVPLPDPTLDFRVRPFQCGCMDGGPGPAGPGTDPLGWRGTWTGLYCTAEALVMSGRQSIGGKQSHGVKATGISNVRSGIYMGGSLWGGERCYGLGLETELSRVEGR